MVSGPAWTRSPVKLRSIPPKSGWTSSDSHGRIQVRHASAQLRGFSTTKQHTKSQPVFTIKQHRFPRNPNGPFPKKSIGRSKKNDNDHDNNRRGPNRQNSTPHRPNNNSSRGPCTHRTRKNHATSVKHASNVERWDISGMSAEVKLPIF